MRITKKLIERCTMALIMALPVGYLFVTQIFALAGAHGEEVLAEPTEFTPSYDELMKPEKFNYGAFDWENEHGTRLGFSFGSLELFSSDAYLIGGNYTFTPFGVSFNDETSLDYVNTGLGFSEYNEPYGTLYYNSSTFSTGEIVGNGSFYSCMYTRQLEYGDTPTFAFVFTFDSQNGWSETYTRYTYSNHNSSWIKETILFGDFDDFQDGFVHNIYFDDGQNLPEGVTWNDELTSYFVPTVKQAETTSYRYALFGNMFGKSNFLMDWGEDVLSENPHGFAPFASMIKYLDVNMLHLGEKNYGLMAYGQLYYMLNVSIFFLIYKTMVFIPNIITRAFEWFRKENNEND